MSENRVKYQLSDRPRPVTIPADSVDAFQAKWRQQGLKFELITPAIEEAPDKFSAPEAAARGAARGAGFGLTDDAAGFGAWLAGDKDRSGDGGMQAQWRADDRQSAQEHPVAAATGEVIGSAPSAIALGGGAAAATRAVGMAPRVARFAAPALAGGVEGGAQGAGRSEATTARGVARDAAQGAAIGAGAGAAGEAVIPPFAKWIGSKARGGAATAREIGDEAKVAASGAERGAMKDLRKAPGGIRRYAEGAERLGIGKNRLGVIPATVRQHADDADAALAAATARRAPLEQQIADAGVMVDGADVAARVRALGAKQGTGPAGAAVRAELEDIAQGFERQGRVPFSAMGDELGSWGDATNFQSGTVRQGLRKQIYGTINDVMEDAASSGPRLPPQGRLAEGFDRPTIPAPGGSRPVRPRPRTALDNPPPGKPVIAPQNDFPGEVTPTMRPPGGVRPIPGQLPPGPPPLPPSAELGKKWRQAKEDQHIAIRLGDIGDNRLNTAGNRALSPTDYAAGGAAYLAAGDPLQAAGAVAGNRLLKSREHAVKHQLARGTQHALGAGAGAADALAASPAARAGVSGGAATATQSHAGMSRETAAENDAMADPKYGAMIRGKPQSERGFVIGVLNSQDPEFRARQRDAARKRKGSE